MGELVSISELKRMINDRRDLISFYHEKVMYHKKFLEMEEDALKSRLKDATHKQSEKEIK